MTNTQKYYETHKNFRASMRQLQADRQSALDKVSRFKGSSGYTQEVEQIEKTFKDKAERVAVDARNSFNDVLTSMQENAEKELPIEPPTMEQESLLRALQMREKIKLEELEQASKYLKGNRLALSILDELALKHNYYTHFSNPNTGDAIRTLANFARTTTSMPFVDNKEGYIYGEERRVDLFSADRDFEDVRDCISFAGGISDVQAFSEVVD